jgi:hypothetical protein
MSRMALLVLFAQLATPSQRPTFVVPNFADATIRTRVSRGLQLPMVTTLRLKGGRSRSESAPNSTRPMRPFTAHITQCDQKAMIILFEPTKTYRIHYFHEPSEREVEREEMQKAKPPTGPIVTVTTDSEDTGERRQMGSYEARHIKTTITVDPSKGALTPAGKTEMDGWYLDLPGLNCRVADRGDMPPGSAWHVPVAVGGHDTFKFIKTGNATAGYAVEETSTERSEGNVAVNKTELLEFSDKPLDESLFEIPPDHTEAPTPGPGQVIRNVPTPPTNPPEP